MQYLLLGARPTVEPRAIRETKHNESGAGGGGRVYGSAKHFGHQVLMDESSLLEAFGTQWERRRYLAIKHEDRWKRAAFRLENMRTELSLNRLRSRPTARAL